MEKPDLIIDATAIERIQYLREERSLPDLKLRIIVEGGGCSGFQYKMEMTETKKEDEILFEGCVVTDEISIPYIKHSVVKFEDKLIGADFVIDNPNAQAGCGCGTSFSMM